MFRQRRVLALVVVVGVALGGLIAGVPSRHRDQPLPEVRSRGTTTTTIPNSATHSQG
jgi:hypothetical protein